MFLFVHEYLQVQMFMAAQRRLSYSKATIGLGWRLPREFGVEFHSLEKSFHFISRFFIYLQRHSQEMTMERSRSPPCPVDPNCGLSLRSADSKRTPNGKKCFWNLPFLQTNKQNKKKDLFQLLSLPHRSTTPHRTAPPPARQELYVHPRPCILRLLSDATFLRFHF